MSTHNAAELNILRFSLPVTATYKEFCSLFFSAFFFLNICYYYATSAKFDFIFTFHKSRIWEHHGLPDLKVKTCNSDRKVLSTGVVASCCRETNPTALPVTAHNPFGIGVKVWSLVSKTPQEAVLDSPNAHPMPLHFPPTMHCQMAQQSILLLQEHLVMPH